MKKRYVVKWCALHYEWEVIDTDATGCTGAPNMVLSSHGSDSKGFEAASRAAAKLDKAYRQAMKTAALTRRDEARKAFERMLGRLNDRGEELIP